MKKFRILLLAQGCTWLCQMAGRAKQKDALSFQHSLFCFGGVIDSDYRGFFAGGIRPTQR